MQVPLKWCCLQCPGGDPVVGLSPCKNVLQPLIFTVARVRSEGADRVYSGYPALKKRAVTGRHGTSKLDSATGDMGKHFLKVVFVTFIDFFCTFNHKLS